MMSYWRTWRAILSICVALGWWGLWFPELAFWAEAICVVDEESGKSSVQSAENMIECETARDVYQGLMRADREQIQVKSRLLQLLQEYLFGEDEQ